MNVCLAGVRRAGLVCVAGHVEIVRDRHFHRIKGTVASLTLSLEQSAAHAAALCSSPSWFWASVRTVSCASFSGAEGRDRWRGR